MEENNNSTTTTTTTGILINIFIESLMLSKLHTANAMTSRNKLQNKAPGNVPEVEKWLIHLVLNKE